MEVEIDAILRRAGIREHIFTTPAVRRWIADVTPHRSAEYCASKLVDRAIERWAETHGRQPEIADVPALELFSDAALPAFTRYAAGVDGHFDIGRCAARWLDWADEAVNPWDCRVEIPRLLESWHDDLTDVDALLTAVHLEPSPSLLLYHGTTHEGAANIACMGIKLELSTGTDFGHAFYCSFQLRDAICWALHATHAGLQPAVVVFRWPDERTLHDPDVQVLEADDGIWAPLVAFHRTPINDTPIEQYDAMHTARAAFSIVIGPQVVGRREDMWIAGTARQCALTTPTETRLWGHYLHAVIRFHQHA